ncbi:MAG: zinc ribbon domain-containing protein [Chloroflexi bacterium]|nr:zinc ribbon domain-containing protein [Chloroflexota bacterium]
MRCPYCGGYNPDGTRFCKRCGRDISQPMPPVSRPQQKPPQPPYQPPQRPPYQSPRPTSPVTPIQAPPPSSQQPRQVPPGPPVSPIPQNAPGERVSQQRVRTPLSAPAVPIEPAAPEPPAPFPPRTIAQLQALEQGALPYTVISNEVNYGRKQVIRIHYQHCTGWQQVATLLKAFKEKQSTKSESVVVQGVSGQDTSVYNFTNGQLVFDRNVRLGSQVLNRYQIETENGFASDALRIVLSE